MDDLPHRGCPAAHTMTRKLHLTLDEGTYQSTLNNTRALTTDADHRGPTLTAAGKLVLAAAEERMRTSRRPAVADFDPYTKTVGPDDTVPSGPLAEVSASLGNVDCGHFDVVWTAELLQVEHRTPVGHSHRSDWRIVEAPDGPRGLRETAEVIGYLDGVGLVTAHVARETGVDVKLEFDVEPAGEISVRFRRWFRRYDLTADVSFWQPRAVIEPLPGTWELTSAAIILDTTPILSVNSAPEGRWQVAFVSTNQHNHAPQSWVMSANTLRTLLAARHTHDIWTH